MKDQAAQEVFLNVFASNCSYFHITVTTFNAIFGGLYAIMPTQTMT